jgi:hypothetical protein
LGTTTRSDFLSRKLTIVLAVMGLLVFGGIASAAPEEERDDTVFNFGYDEENEVFAWGSAPIDGLYNCAIEVEGSLKATYGITPDGLVTVEGLHNMDDTVVQFQPTPEDQLSEDIPEPATEPVDYPGPEGECGLAGGIVSGPNGQVNHGMFMKLFNSLYEGKGRGCLVRHIAQSDLGKGDQQVLVSEVDPNEPALVGEVEGELDVASILADCEHGKKDTAGGEETLTGQEKAAAKKAANADKQRGKSADAPGKNKQNP